MEPFTAITFSEGEPTEEHKGEPMKEQELHPTFKAVEVVDVKIPFKSVFALTFKFWLSGLILGIVVSAIVGGIAVAVGLLSIGLNMAVLGM
jgi:hypothetical protein